MAKDLAGKVAIITGSAGGLGKALAEAMAERGCYLVIADIKAGLLEETAAQLRATGAQVDAKAIDVRDAQQVQALVEGAFRELGRIDYMFNNAAVNVFAELRDTSLEDWNQLIDVNLGGVVHGVHAAYPIMREQGFGHIVNTASLAGLAPAVAEGAYSATKHAVVALSAALRVEAEAFGVQVSVVCPGVIETPILDNTKYVNFPPDAITRFLPEKPMPTSTAARQVLDGVARKRFFIVITKTAHAIWRIYRVAPEGSLRLGRRVVAQLRSIRTEND